MIDRALARAAHDDPDDNGALKALQLIQNVGDVEPFHLVPVVHHQGSAMSAAEVMANKVKWARKAGYRVLTWDVPERFAPYNAVIRVSERGTEDQNRDYLAHIVDAAHTP